MGVDRQPIRLCKGPADHTKASIGVPRMTEIGPEVVDAGDPYRRRGRI
jgi:hypothetical protein